MASTWKKHELWLAKHLGGRRAYGSGSIADYEFGDIILDNSPIAIECKYRKPPNKAKGVSGTTPARSIRIEMDWLDELQDKVKKYGHKEGKEIAVLAFKRMFEAKDQWEMVMSLQDFMKLAVAADYLKLPKGEEDGPSVTGD